MKWFSSPQWRDHCAAHLESWRTLHCEAIKYRHTIIRPAYCPFCLWDLERPAEERLQYWSRNGHLRDHIESQHVPKMRWPTTEPLCGCSQTFQDEREIRRHLHDAHGLKDAIWRNPKPPRKRKCACNNESLNPPMSTREEQPKKSRFSPYIPPRQGFEGQLSNNTIAPTPSVNLFIMEHPEVYRYSKNAHQLSATSGTASVASCFSRKTSSFSSRSTSPGLDVIDPRILGAQSFTNDNEPQSSEQVTEKSQSRSLSHNLQRILPPQPTINHHNKGYSGNNLGGKAIVVRDELGIPNPFSHQAHKRGDSGDDDSLDLKEYHADPNHKDSAKVASGNERAQSHLMRESHVSRRLNARDRRRLLALKSEKMTLRQIGSQFAHLDTDFLRQVWGELKPLERCTRSRTLRKR
jgi:hypothetical protein